MDMRLGLVPLAGVLVIAMASGSSVAVLESIAGATSFASASANDTISYGTQVVATAQEKGQATEATANALIGGGVPSTSDAIATTQGALGLADGIPGNDGAFANDVVQTGSDKANATAAFASFLTANVLATGNQGVAVPVNIVSGLAATGSAVGAIELEIVQSDVGTALFVVGNVGDLTDPVVRDPASAPTAVAEIAQERAQAASALVNAIVHG